ncbi:MAG: hypothetical protein K5773_02790 [Pseudobutyrivibrio sp.]|nr:hypothetical protein [Pseudobutyrivibrio sp.]
MSEKLSNSDKDNIKKLTNDQINSIIKDKMADAKVEMEDVLSERIDQAMETMDRKTDKETTDKIMEISQYSDTVLQSIEKSDQQVAFMYSMLNEKQEMVTELTKELAELKDSLGQIDTAVSKKLDFLNDREIEIEEKEREAMEKVEMAEKSNPPFNEVLAEKFLNEDKGQEKKNSNLEILKLHDLGLSEVDIAKKLGRGLGEVKFVLGLYQEDRK